MKKRYLFSAIGIGAASYLLTSKRNRNKLKEITQTFFGEDTSSKKPTVMDNAGIPDQYTGADIAQLENAKMVSEGSQFGVQYYNKVNEGEYM